ncbi:hypothetical protein D7Y55_01410 [Stenotrophomonas maltophilia]|nr:hypothetical protein [Stenotrophomonas maltophilia]
MGQFYPRITAESGSVLDARQQQVAAAWTTKPAGVVGEAELPPLTGDALAFPTTAEGIDTVQRVLTMTPEEIDALFKR